MNGHSAFTILIAESAGRDVEVPPDLEQYVRYTPDPGQGVVSLLSEEQSLQTSLLLIVRTPHIRPLLKILEGFSPESVSYRIAAVTPSEFTGDARRLSASLFDLRTAPVNAEELRFIVEKAHVSMHDEVEEPPASPNQEALVDAWKDQEALITIGKALSLEHNPDTLLRTILSLSKKITGADAGSIFLVEKDEEDRKRLRFKYSHTFSMPLNYEEFVMPMDTSSIAGYVAVTGRVLNISDVYDIDASAPYTFNPSFDRSHGYRTKSMLVLPMRGNTDEVIGVIQLINSKEREHNTDSNAAFEISLKSPEDFVRRVYPFKRRYEGLMEAVAGQAAIAIENNRMLKQIEHEFEAFVKASVMAVESRDPATSGHSFRVAAMCTNTAEAIDRSGEGPWREEHFSPLRLKALEFAGLLHDFGKVYIDPSIFQKEKKLFHKDFENLRLRLHLIRRSLEAGEVRAQREKRELIDELQRILRMVRKLNEPAEEELSPGEQIKEILSVQSEVLCVDPEGSWIPILTDEDHENLQISRGNLNPKERAEIESHVQHTYNFVRRIPWPAEFAAIPDITYAHHEKLDGSGYPRGLSGRESIPLEARIMAVADIYDALCAADRPYKRALSRERVFEILRWEAGQGKLDGDVVEIFISSEAWDVPLDLHHRSVPAPDGGNGQRKDRYAEKRMFSSLRKARTE
jgi:HD-GYP domain-containing protein (c-di-GMP phosphodiesterase class II)